MISESLKIGLMALLGLIVFVLGQILQRIFIEPIQEMRRTVGKAAHTLKFYANFSHQMTIPAELDPLSVGRLEVVGKTPEIVEEATIKLRKLASDLRALPFVIPGYEFFATIGMVPSRTAVDVASSNLIGWSNSLGQKHDVYRHNIANALNIST